MIALAVFMLCLGDSNTAGWGLRPSEPSYAQILECEIDGHPGFGVLRDPAFGTNAQIIAQAAVKEASFRNANVIVLSFLTNDVWSNAPVEKIARVMGQRYRQARKTGARVLVVPPLVWVDGEGEVAATLRARQAELVGLLPSVVDPLDLVDVSGIGEAEHADHVHLNALGHASLAAAIVGALER